jgi:hypothetical protein
MTMTKNITLGLVLLLVMGCTNKQREETPTINVIESPATSPSGEPYLFTDDNGDVYLSWIEGAKDDASFKFSKLDGAKWTLPVPISSGKDWFVNWADYPMIATNGKEFIAHFLQKSGKGTYAYNVMLTSSGDRGKSWNPPVVLNEDGKEAEHGFVSLLPYNDGFFATWLDGRNTVMEGMEHHEGHHGQMSLRAAVLAKDGSKINEWELDERTCDCCQTSAAITAQGPVVVYRDRSQDEIRDMSIVRLDNGEWTKPVAVYNDNWKIEGCPVNGPRIIADGNNLAVAWFSMPDNKAQVNVIFSQDGGETFGKPIRVDEGRVIGRVDVVMSKDGDAVVSWMEGMVIKAAKVNRDGKVGTPVVIATSSESRSSGFPQMTIAGEQLLFAWTDDKDKTVKVASVKM